MTRASDKVLHAQLVAIAESARAAIAGERLVVIAQFWDEEVGKTANMTTFDSREPEVQASKEIAELIHLVLQSAASMVPEVGMELGLRLPGGEWKKFEVDKPTGVNVDLEDLDG